MNVQGPRPAPAPLTMSQLPCVTLPSSCAPLPPEDSLLVTLESCVQWTCKAVHSMCLLYYIFANTVLK